MATIATTTVEHLGPDADDLNLDAYRLAALILRGPDTANEDWAIETAWNNGDWVSQALKVLTEAYPSLSIDDQVTFEAFQKRYA